MPTNRPPQPVVTTVSIGNTSTTAITWSHLEAREFCPKLADFAGLNSLANRLAAENKAAPILIASVVPSSNAILLKLLKKKSRRPILIFREDLAPKMEIIPEPAEKIGADRIASALGALTINPATPWIVVDAGTALTCNAIQPARRGKPPCFEGGLIIPGAALSLKALAANTAQLPELNLAPAAAANLNFIGRCTAEAMRNGVMLAQAGAILAMLKGQRALLGPRTRVAITGGGAEALLAVLKAIAPAASKGLRIYPLLAHLGLFSAWRSAEKLIGRISPSSRIGPMK
jgi:type III pantothenate kinase